LKELRMRPTAAACGGKFVCLGGLTVSLPCEDLYSIFGEGNGLSGFLISSDENKELNARADGLIAPTARFSAQQSRAPTATESTPFVVSAVSETVAGHRDHPLPGRCCVPRRHGALAERPDRAP
jgi:hypothetical protein